MSKTHHLDANVILRFLLADDPKQSPKARELFALAQAERLTLRISHVTLAEVTWVLHSYYEFERSNLAQTLREFVMHDGLEIENGDVVLDAFERFGKANLDFIDCYTAALAKHTGGSVVTDDRDFRKFSDVTAQRPEEVIAALNRTPPKST
jgi:predicted nucleic acid-binding protein